MKKRALISVSDKRGIVEFAKGLNSLGYEIISTGGTLDVLKKEGVNAVSITDITGFPECLDGRVKTLHPAVHAGLLALRGNKGHMETLEKLNINTIDVVAVNLYPFAQTIAKTGVSFEEAVENIDIGGPSMVRSAAKNYQSVLILTDPNDYGGALERIKNNNLDGNFRLFMMYKAYAHTAAYDSLIASYLYDKCGLKEFPDSFTPSFKKIFDLRYGENPHQKAAFYGETGAKSGTIAQINKLQGKELSFLNIADINASVELIKDLAAFSMPAAVAVKHAIPCGAALGETLSAAFKSAYECDSVSIFGGIVALNRPVDKALAEEMAKIFLEVIIAPEFSDGALEVFNAKPNLRLIVLSALDKPNEPCLDYKRVSGGLLIQETDTQLTQEFNVVSGKALGADLSEKDKRELNFALTLVKHVKSNAIVLTKDCAAVGISGGETNRVWAAKQAILRAGERANGAVAASDAFFPFADSVVALIESGVKAIIQPGGSVRDNESIAECQKANVTMVLCGMRHFKH